jgi:hypothetical protein
MIQFIGEIGTSEQRGSADDFSDIDAHLFLKKDVQAKKIYYRINRTYRRNWIYFVAKVDDKSFTAFIEEHPEFLLSKVSAEQHAMLSEWESIIPDTWRSFLEGGYYTVDPPYLSDEFMYLLYYPTHHLLLGAMSYPREPE